MKKLIIDGEHKLNKKKMMMDSGGGEHVEK